MMLVCGVRIVEIRIMPYPPNLSKMAASTIDPAIGASTWAFGNHRCSPYSGIFTINAIMHANHISDDDHLFGIGFAISCMIVIFNEPVEFCR